VYPARTAPAGSGVFCGLGDVIVSVVSTIKPSIVITAGATKSNSPSTVNGVGVVRTVIGRSWAWLGVTTYDVPLPDTIFVFVVIPPPVTTAPTGSVADVLNVSVVPTILPLTDMVAGTLDASNVRAVRYGVTV
jgi:hypothetical protein